MNGFATQNKLRAVNHHRGDDSHASDDDYAFRHGRASDKVMGYAADEFKLPRRPFMPDFIHDRHERSAVTTVTRHGSLGTPGEARRDRMQRLESIWKKACAIGVALILCLAALWSVNAPATKEPRQFDTGIQYREKAARLVSDTSLYVNEFNEGCLIGMHKDATGQIIVSTHC